MSAVLSLAVKDRVGGVGGVQVWGCRVYALDFGELWSRFGSSKGGGPALLGDGILIPGVWVGDGDGARRVGDVGAGAPDRTVVGQGYISAGGCGLGGMWVYWSSWEAKPVLVRLQDGDVGLPGE